MNDLISTNVTCFRYDSNTRVGLNVEWTPGEKTGQTNYTVVVADSTDGSIIASDILEGYESTKHTVLDLDGYREYNVTVFGETKTGRSNPETQLLMTKTTVPDVIRNLAIVPDNIYARRMSLEFECPLEANRNGIITGFSIIKTDHELGTTTSHSISNVTLKSCADVIKISSIRLGQFDIKHNYTFQVIARNQDFESIPSDPVTFYTYPKDITGSHGEDGAGLEMHIIIIIAALAIGAIIVLVVVFRCARRSRGTKEQAQPEEGPEVGTINGDNVGMNVHDLSLNESRKIKIREFKSYVSYMHTFENIIFHREFEFIKELSDTFQSPSRPGLTFPMGGDVVRRENLKYSLASLDMDAVFIPGLRSTQDYIATQGPSDHSITQFWTMVWNNNVDLIVMLAGLEQNDKMRAELFESHNLDPVTYGIFTIEVITISRVKNYIVREMRLSFGNTQRRIIHLYLPTWWDPDIKLIPVDILDFVKNVRKLKNSGNPSPLLVQCSDGVGRTGIFLALDYFMQKIQSLTPDDYVDVFRYVLEMRTYRCDMVQDEAQYIFIFDKLVQLMETLNKDEGSYEHIYESADGAPPERCVPITSDSDGYERAGAFNGGYRNVISSQPGGDFTNIALELDKEDVL